MFMDISILPHICLSKLSFGAGPDMQMMLLLISLQCVGSGPGFIVEARVFTIWAHFCGGKFVGKSFSLEMSNEFQSDGLSFQPLLPSLTGRTNR